MNVNHYSMLDPKYPTAAHGFINPYINWKNPWLRPIFGANRLPAFQAIHPSGNAAAPSFGVHQQIPPSSIINPTIDTTGSYVDLKASPCPYRNIQDNSFKKSYTRKPPEEDNKLSIQLKKLLGMCQERKRKAILRSRHPSQARYSFAASTLLETVSLDMSNIKDWAILDSGATSHFLVTAAPATDVTSTKNPLRVRLPDGSMIASTATCNLALPQLPSEARKGHIIPGLANHSLLSVVKLCNAGCEVTFTMIDCTVRYRGKTILRGKK